ncbi:uncharacterized protein JCM10292_005988 [Rhodotorula paludigena]|uniref:uncharacterized protein n=1 Tax=Rhodotorula paludigena TaxID=86838 RepID=UPI0031715AF1
MPFGLTNALPVFQTFISSLFQCHIGPHSYVVVYFDNILVYLRNQEDHKQHLRAMLQDLLNSQLFAKLKKCEFAKSKDVAFDIGPDSDAFASFNSLRAILLKAPVLQSFDLNSQIIVITDALKYALSAQLHQPEDDGQLHPVAFHLCQFLPAELKYRTYDQQMLATVGAFEAFRHWCHGLPHPVVIKTDHNNLTYFRLTCRLLPCQARWYRNLVEFAFIIQHLPGRKNLSDAPSCRPGFVPSPSDLLRNNHLAFQFVPNRQIDPNGAPNLDLSVVPESATENATAATPSIPPSTSSSPLCLATTLFTLPLHDLVKDLKNAWATDNKLQDALRESHEDFAMNKDGHRGYAAMYHLVHRTFDWPGLHHAIKRDVVGMDHIFDLPPSSGFSAILVLIGHLTLQVHLVPAKTINNATKLACQFIQHIFRLQGRGKNFWTKLTTFARSSWWSSV